MRTISAGVLIPAMLLLVFMPQVLEAGGGRTSPRLSGMAGSNSDVYGIDAAGINPAMIAPEKGRGFEISILPAGGFRLGSNFLNNEMYSAYFSGVDDPATGERVGRHLTEKDKRDILNSFPSGIGKINIDARIMWFGAAFGVGRYGTVAFKVTDRLSGNAEVPDDYMRMLLYGLPESGVTYDFGGTSIRSWWIRGYTFSYATPRLNLSDRIEWVTFGAGVRYVAGLAYFGTESYEGVISNTGIDNGFMLTTDLSVVTRRASADYIHDSANHGFSAFKNAAGGGWGFDLGVAAGISEKITAGIALTDIGSVQWRRNTYGSESSGRVEIDDLFSREQRDSLESVFLGSDFEIGSFSTPLPAALRAGFVMRVNHNLSAAVEYLQGFNKMPANSTAPRISVGAEWRPFGFLPLRSGIALGGADRFSWAIGFGFRFSFFAFDVATENAGILFYPNKSKNASVMLGTRFAL